MNIQLAATAEELQAEISPIQRFVKGVRHFDATFKVEGLVFPQRLCTVRGRNECTTNTLPLEVFSQRNFVADLIQLKLTFIPKKEKFAF